jgi:hypothetical protein
LRDNEWNRAKEKGGHAQVRRDVVLGASEGSIAFSSTALSSIQTSVATADKGKGKGESSCGGCDDDEDDDDDNVVDDDDNDTENDGDNASGKFIDRDNLILRLNNMMTVMSRRKLVCVCLCAICALLCVCVCVCLSLFVCSLIVMI